MRRTILVALAALLAVVIALPVMAWTLPGSFGSFANLFGLSSNSYTDSETANDSDASNNTAHTLSTNTPNANNKPAVSQRFSQRSIESGSAAPSVSVSNTGNGTFNVCSTVQQDTNTNDVVNQQVVVQSGTQGGDIVLQGSKVTPGSSSSNTSCNQAINQSVSTR